jgi:hypothetical protein
MWNAVSFLKQYCRATGVSSTWRALARAAALLVLTAAPPQSRVSVAMAQETQPPGTPAPQLARLFVPRHVLDGTYQVTVMKEGVDRALRLVMAALAPGARPGEPPGAWQVQRLDPLEAFGTAGVYDRSKVARLYIGRRASIVRGSIGRDRRVVAAVTLISPYPDPTLSRLEEGTMVILLRLAQ